MSDAPFRKLLIANRGEIAIRIARAAAELRIASVAIYSEDDAASLHLRKADEAHALGRRGRRRLSRRRAASWRCAKATGCDAIHPGYGFLAENAGFARAVRRGGPDLRRPVARGARAVRRQGLGARTLARRVRRPGDRRRRASAALEEARAFFAAIRRADHAQGRSRRRRARHARGSSEAEIAEAFARCQSEARPRSATARSTPSA